MLEIPLLTLKHLNAEPHSPRPDLEKHGIAPDCAINLDPYADQPDESPISYVDILEHSGPRACGYALSRGNENSRMTWHSWVAGCTEYAAWLIEDDKSPEKWCALDVLRRLHRTIREERLLTSDSDDTQKDGPAVAKSPVTEGTPLLPGQLAIREGLCSAVLELRMLYAKETRTMEANGNYMALAVPIALLAAAAGVRIDWEGQEALVDGYNPCEAVDEALTKLLRKLLRQWEKDPALPDETSQPAALCLLDRGRLQECMRLLDFMDSGAQRLAGAYKKAHGLILFGDEASCVWQPLWKVWVTDAADGQREILFYNPDFDAYFFVQVAPEYECPAFESMCTMLLFGWLLDGGMLNISAHSPKNTPWSFILLENEDWEELKGQLLAFIEQRPDLTGFFSLLVFPEENNILEYCLDLAETLVCMPESPLVPSDSILAGIDTLTESKATQAFVFWQEKGDRPQ